jgi:hypothetical protein
MRRQKKRQEPVTQKSLFAGKWAVFWSPPIELKQPQPTPSAPVPIRVPILTSTRADAQHLFALLRAMIDSGKIDRAAIVYDGEVVEAYPREEPQD